ncbi:hypothetical protein L596_003572 [Steinernema carpocapsae]|uniref:receptor protein-tyrosine kinase n=1 Tax=Steinernema carpocapsae TaxID=34508 RepID=A0A4U8UW71_STECR|nr:hypothetical protein L596_003572 [Steinernema carpocapsae]
MALFTSRTLPSIWAFFVITYIHSASSTPDLQNIRTFHVFQDLVAVGIEDYITIHRFDDLMNDISKAERKVSLKRTFNGSDVSVEILHLRLLNSTNLSYCDPFACWFCYVDSKESKCNGYFINSPGQRQRQMKVVQCVTNHVHMTVRFLDEGHNASIVRFNLAPISNEQIPIYPLNEAMDAEGSSIFEQNLVDGFQFNGFTYFFGSALRIDPLECKKNDRPSECYDPKNLKENVRVTRICDKDETKHLESRIDISLSCEPSHFNSALAAYFEESQGVVSIAFGLRNFTQISICTFNISDIEKQFEFTWSTCQKVTDDKQCKKKNTAAYPECKISSREFDNKGYRVCKKYFYKSPKYLPSEHIDICSLGNYNETTYRYGWLENFAALPGKHKLSVVLNSSDVTEGFLTAHSASGSWFLISKGKGRLPRLDRFVSSANYSIWNVNGVDAIPIIHSSATNRLFYARANSVQMQDIACESLYKNCNEVPDLSAKDPLECGWCVVKNKAGTSVSAGDKHSCNGQITFDGCPPAIDRTVKEKDGNLTIYGSNFNKLSDMSITACGKPCSLLEHRESKLICKMEQLADYCAVNVSGKLPHTNAFHANYEGESSTSSSTSVSKKDTTTLKAVISVVSIIIIMLLIGLIVYLMRRYQQKKKRKSRNPSNSGQHMIPPMPASNDYKPFPGGYNGNADPYEAIFGSFAGHRIKINNLQYEHKPVGQGFFGSVFRGTYVLNGKSLDVACKALKTDRINSTADFLREAEVMAQLSHHRVLPFVGLFYDLSNRKYPTLLVTQFMPNGDLFHYIQDEHRIITLNELLNFCLQAAEGMEYLHTQGWIHRDLAARNCMLDARLNLYLADFGLTRKFEVEETGSYYTALSTRELPITSLSLEAFSGKFSTKSDVWAFGNMMWEVVTRGWIPWERLSKTELVERLRNGDRLAKPEHCPPEIYRNIMLPCWAENKDMRPSFSEIIEVTETTIIDLRKREESRMNSNYERVAPRHA